MLLQVISVVSSLGNHTIMYDGLFESKDFHSNYGELEFFILFRDLEFIFYEVVLFCRTIPIETFSNDCTFVLHFS